MYNFKCEEHGIFSEVLSYDCRDEPQECPKCSLSSPRTWEGHTVGQTKASFLDGTGRFDDIRESNRLKKEKMKARSKGDVKESDRINKEMKKVVK